MLLLNGCSFVWGDELEGFDTSPTTHWPLTFGHQLAEKLDIDYDNIAACGNCNQKIFRDTIDYLTTKDVPSHMVILWSDPIRKETLLEVTEEDEERMLKVPRSISMTQWHENRFQDLELSMSPRVVQEFSNHLLFNNVKTFKRDRRTVDVYLSTFCTGMTHQLSLMLAMQTLCDGMNIKLVQGIFHRNARIELAKYLTRIERQKETSQQVKDWRLWVFSVLEKLRPECQVGLSEGDDKTIRDFQEPRPLKKQGHPDEQAHKEFAEYIVELFP
tara:strand:+ start:1403 stop:2218 length:816 start_codon:yes stop_codon:yes gene_type:complete